MRKQLLEAGYREFKPNEWLHKYAVRAYQLAVRDDNGKLFFITVHEYDPIGPQEGQQFNAEAQFENANGRTFDVSLHYWETVEELNAFFKGIYFEMACVPYDK
jgi:hypothetical protein